MTTASEKETLACVSIQKTGSTALVAALRQAGFGSALHLHFLGPQAQASGAAQPDGSPKVGERVSDPHHRFRIVTSVRDPVARILSLAFHNAAGGTVPDPAGVIAWIGRRRFGEASTPWFDDTFNATFGFDFRRHPFDRARRSIRFASPRLTLLALRQEDAPAYKERELGWLIARDRVAIPRANGSATRFGTAYERFVESFRAPPRWLDALYDADLVRHFYSDQELAAFRRRWSE